MSRPESQLENRDIPKGFYAFLKKIEDAKVESELQIVKFIKNPKKFKKYPEKEYPEKEYSEKELDYYKGAAKNFIVPIEGANSPQEVDLYISYIEDAQQKLYGEREENENPVALKRVLRFLKEKYKKAVEEKARLTSVAGAVSKPLVGAIKEGEFSLLRELSVWIPDSLEGWTHKGITSEMLGNAISAYEAKITKITKIISEENKASTNEKIFLDKKIKALDDLIDYAENSKKNFNRRLVATGYLQINSVVFSVLSGLANVLSKIAQFCSLVPVVNLVAEGAKKTFEMINFASLTTIYAIDPSAPKAEKLAAFRHYEALKQYMIAEVSLGMVGTLGLATGFLLPVIPAASGAVAAMPVLGPVLVVIGTGLMAISNIIACVNAYNEWQYTKKMLASDPLFNKLSEIKEKEAREPLLLLTAEKKLLRADKMVQACNAKFLSKLASAIGATLLTLTAAAVFAAALVFPPVAIALMVTTMMFSGIALYKQHHQKTYSKQSFAINNDLENEALTEAISRFKQEVKPKEEALEQDRKEKLKQKDKGRFKHELAPVYAASREGEHHAEKEKNAPAVEALKKPSAPEKKIDGPVP